MHARSQPADTGGGGGHFPQLLDLFLKTGSSQWQFKGNLDF